MITAAVSILFFSLALCQQATAQNTTPSFKEMERQMMEMQRQLMEQLRNSPFNDPNFAVPKWDTTFFFQFDTTFEGGNMSQFFRFSPFGADSTLRGDFFGFGRLFDQFFNPGGQFGQPDDSIRDLPQDDGGLPRNEDDLLPEERLRQDEETEKSGKKQPAPTPKPADPKPDPKVKTIRI